VLSSPTQEHTVPLGSLFFYNTRNAGEADYRTLVDMAENGTGADILVISAGSDGELSAIMEPLNWSGVWSVVVNDVDQNQSYLGNYSQRGIELHIGMQAIGNFLRDDDFVAVTNASALPGGVASEVFLHSRIIPRENVWTFKNLSTPSQNVYESTQFIYNTLRGYQQSILGRSWWYNIATVDAEFSTFTDRRISSRINDVVPSGSIEAARIGLGFQGAVMVQLTEGEVFFAYPTGDYVNFGKIGIYEGPVTQMIGDVSFASMFLPPQLHPGVGVVVGIVVVAHYLSMADQSSGLEREYYYGLVAATTIDVTIVTLAAIFLTPLGAFLVIAANVVWYGITWLASQLGFLSGPMTIGGTVVALWYWARGEDTPEEKMKKKQEKLDDIQDWLGNRIAEHVAKGEIAFFVGGLSFLEED
ncbi:MAG: hypothetical protein ACE5IO_02495, partial [Thermoplasmata archaeon]